MQPTKIKWVRSPDGSRGFSWNPIRGLCKINCPYCYSKAIYKRFKLDPEVRFDTVELYRPFWHKKPMGIFVCSTHELFGNWIAIYRKNEIFSVITRVPQHRFYVLTKRPGNIHMDEMPPNVWLGVTITGEESEEKQITRLESLMDVKARIHFISFEPLLGPIAEEVLDHIADGGIDWVIVGIQTQPTKLPLWDWVDNIIYAKEQSPNTALFMKNNLTKLHKIVEPLLLIQGFPKEK